MKTFSKVFVRFVLENPHLTLFTLGFAVFLLSLSQWQSGPVAGVVGGGILMAVAIYPLVMVRKG